MARLKQTIVGVNMSSIDLLLNTYSLHRYFFCMFGKNPAIMPSNGRKALT